MEIWEREKREEIWEPEKSPISLERLHLDVLIPAIAAVVLEADVALLRVRVECVVEFVGRAVGAFVGSGEFGEVALVDLFAVGRAIRCRGWTS